MPVKVETDTNQVYRRKYFVSAETIVRRGKEGPAGAPQPAVHSRVIPANRVNMLKRPVLLRCTANQPDTEPANENIQVEVVKAGAQVKALRIDCPCGRHAELDVTYAAGK